MGDAVRSLSIIALTGVPLVRPGDDLPALILAAIAETGLELRAGDVLALAQKIVSKAEGRQVALADVTPSSHAIDLAAQCAKDPRLVELVLSESSEVMRARPGVLIVRHRLGLVLANAGIDQSNIDHHGAEQALLLPVDPDGSAARIRTAIAQATGIAPGVAIIDSLGRAWRLGTTGTAIGLAGLPALADLRGHADLFGRPLQSSELGLADEIAAAASLAMGQTAERTPLVLLRGLDLREHAGHASDLVRAGDKDLFP